MLSQSQSLKVYVAAHLSDVIDWNRDVKEDANSTPDLARVTIRTLHNEYKLALGSSYAEPPAGAHIDCRSRGWIDFYDPAANKRIIVPKSDLAWMEIAKHVCERELTDGLAAERRNLAEANPETAGLVRVKLLELAAKAKKWGIEVKVPDEPMPAVAPPQPTPAVAPSQAVQSAPKMKWDEGTGWSPMPAVPPAPGAPWLGAPVIFITNPGERISGMQEIPGHIVKIYDGGKVCVFITADNSEPIYRDGLFQRGTSAGNGRLHEFNCWDFNPTFVRLFEDVTAFRQKAEEADRTIADLTAKQATTESALADLMARMAAAESPEPANVKAHDRGRKGATAA
jgi:hypothetical protein